MLIPSFYISVVMIESYTRCGLAYGDVRITLKNRLDYYMAVADCFSECL